jgi:indole-3-glycerol phosphate synthase
MILDDIVARKKERLIELKSKSIQAKLEKAATLASKPRDFTAALKQGGKPAVIAEIKKASPSAGEIRPNFEVAEIAKGYERAGAAAISVITEEDFFHGKLSYLTEVKTAVSLPILCKDFIIDPIQVVAARAAGADALLLIAAILEQIEVHNEEEMERVLTTDARIIGINNRNLRTFQVSLDTTFRLRPSIPSDRLVVSESGIQEQSDVQSLASAAVDAVLVGTSLMRAEDPEAKLRELLGGV